MHGLLSFGQENTRSLFVLTVTMGFVNKILRLQVLQGKYVVVEEANDKEKDNQERAFKKTR